MKLIIIFLSIYILSISQNTGIYKMRFLDFDHFTEVNARDLIHKKSDIHPTYISGNEIEDFVFNIGLSTKTKCDRKAIACIKYKGDDNVYSVSSAETWDTSEIGHNISFVSNISVRITLPPSKNSTLSINLKNQVQLTMYFIFSESSDIYLLSQSSSNLILVISDKSLNHFIFDHISLYCDYLSFYIGLIFIVFGLFFMIPSQKLYKTQIMFQQIFFFVFLLVFFSSLLVDFFVTLKDQIHNVFLRYVAYLAIIASYSFLIYNYAKNCLICGAIEMFQKIDECRRYVIMVPYFLVSVILIYLIICFLIAIANIWVALLLDFAFIIAWCYLSYSNLSKLCIISHIYSGSYIFVRGLSAFLGGFPNEIEISFIVRSGNKFPYTFFFYFFGIILISVLTYFYLKKQSEETVGPKSSISNDEEMNIDTPLPNN